MRPLFASVFFSLAILSSAAPREDGRNTERKSSGASYLSQLRARRAAGWLDCKPLNGRCSGFPPCCDSNVCYFPNGFPSRTGTCVQCVARTQVCQRDAQCCEPLVCQKDRGYDANGKCDVKKPLNAECHDNDQCESEFCRIHWYNDAVMGHGGRCAVPDSV